MYTPTIFREDLFDNLFNEVPEDQRTPGVYTSTASDYMKSDIIEHEDCFEIFMDLPGCFKEDVNAKLKDGYLKVTATRRDPNAGKRDAGKYIRRERSIGTTIRSFFVGEEIKQKDIKAIFDEGILRITLPRPGKKNDELEEDFIDIK